MTNLLALSLKEVSLSHPHWAHAVSLLGLKTSLFPQLALGEALETLGLGQSTDALLEHTSLWADFCDVCWPSMTVDGIIEHILDQHHRFLRAELPRLQTLLHRAINAASATEAHTAKKVLETFAGLKAELEVHLMKEEQILFPLAHQLATASTLFPIHCGTVRNPIGVMMEEHHDAKHALAEIRQATQDFALPAAPTPLIHALYAGLYQLERDLHAHIREEDDILFPRLLALEDELFHR